MPSRRSLLQTLSLLPLGCATTRPTSPLIPFTIDTAFPGGNLRVERLAPDQAHVKPDVRDTAGPWFYWYFRVRGAAGRKLTFHFTEGDPVGVHGPAVSLDGGRRWSWLGASGSNASFTYTFAADQQDVRFAVALPYVQQNLDDVLVPFQNHPDLRRDLLCKTHKGRAVERLWLGSVAPDAPRVLLTARHHACESVASYVLEGVLAALLSDDAPMRDLRARTQFLVIPFMDKDGVEDGDQGKNRRPRDHNRDYDGTSVHPSTAALRSFVPAWARDRLKLALDFHCPYIRGPHNETIYFVGSEEQDHWRRVLRLAETLQEVQRGPLRYNLADNVPFGTAWNTAAAQKAGKSFARWAREFPGATSATLEFAYANANGQAVTVDNARAFGRDLATAIGRFVSV